MTKTYVFTYGTLKQGYGNHHHLMGAKLLGKAVSSSDHYVLTSFGIPFLRELVDDEVFEFSGKIAGEVYEVDKKQLASCDRLEGHPNAYCREEREFVVEGKEVTAWVYLYQRHEWHPEDAVKPIDGVLTWDMRGHRRVSRMETY